MVTVVSLLASAVVGGLGGVVARIGHTVFTERRAKKRLRRSLYEEIVTMSEDIHRAAHMLNTVSADGDSVTIPTDTFVTTTYESAVERIGLLDEREARTVVEFYSSCFHARRVLASVPTDDDVSPETVFKLRSAMGELNDRMLTTMATLESRLDENVNRSQKFQRVSLDDDPGQISVTEIPLTDADEQPETDES